jgi:hypothetical protein
VLELRPNCELCDRDLPPDDPSARICSYECTFCDACVTNVLQNVCPNCGGGFVSRPIRPRHSWRTGTGLTHDRPSAQRRRAKYSLAQINELTARLQELPPGER